MENKDDILNENLNLDNEENSIENTSIENVDNLKDDTIEENNEINETQSSPIIEDIVENQVEEQKTEEKNLITVRPIKFQEFKETPPNRTIKKNLDILQDVTLHVSVELGRTKSSIREVMELEKGSIVELDKIAGEQVEVYVNDKLVAKGEVIVIEDKFGVRITNTNIQKNI